MSIYAKDAANPAKEQGPVNVSFTVDTSMQKPVFNPAATSSRQNAEGVLLLNNRQANLAGTAEPNSDIAFSANGQPVGTTRVNADGRFSAAVQLFDGENEVMATATKGGNSATSDPLKVLIDVDAPTIGNANPEPGTRTQETTITMSVSISDVGSGIDPNSLTFVLDGNRRINDFSFEAGNGLLSYTRDLAEGNHFFSVTATDFAGNRRTFNSGLFAVDLTAPTVAHFAPEDGATISNSTLEISAIIDTDDIQSVGVQLFPTENPTALIAGKMDFTVSAGRVRFIPNSPLSNGTYQVTILAKDIAGNTSDPGKSSIIFGIDTEYMDSTAPDVVPRYPKPGQAISTSSVVAIQFQILDADAGVDFDTMIVEVNGAVVDITGVVTVLLPNQQQFSPGGGLRDPLEIGQFERGLATGVNSLTVTVGDKMGNFRAYSYNFTVSTAAPSSPVLNFGESITQRPDGTRYTHLAEIPVTGEVPDIDVVSASKVEFYVNGARAGIVPVDADGTFYLESLFLTTGDNQITAFTVSEAGLQSDSATPQVVVLDTTPPSIEFVALPTLNADVTRRQKASR